MKPRFKVVVNGKDITETINQNASKISFHDEDGTSSDDIRLSIEGSFRRPKFGDELKVYLGYKDLNLTYLGSFKVQTSTITNKESMQITATGVDFGSELKVKKSREFIETTLKNIIETIASEHLLKPVCDVNINISYIAQHDQSDLSFLQKIAADNQLIFSIKDNNLVCVSKKQEKIKYTILFNKKAYEKQDST